MQHPLAEIDFIERCWAHEHPDEPDPMLLREDFAGSCAVAAAWCRSDPDRQALAVELDGPTAAWAAERFDEEDLHIVVEDVLQVDGPEVDVTVALNFSVLIYHDWRGLVGYLSHALAGLNPGGLMIMDVFGGSRVGQVLMQGRRVEPDEGGIEPFDYVWEQGAVDAQTGRIACRIHFVLGDGRRLEDAFTYDWRLWRATDLVQAALEAGFSGASIWWSAGAGGRFEPVQEEPAGADWVAYVVCRAPG